MADEHAAIATVLQESRSFPPPADFQRTAVVGDPERHERLQSLSREVPEVFWREVARELHWFTPFTKVRTGEGANTRWFEDGQTNLAFNCLDRHLDGAVRNRAALVWEGEPGDSRTLTYLELHREVCRMANALQQLGLAKGDRVGIYMPMVPEAVVGMLACARLGLVHSVVFGGFSAEALKDRMNDAGAKAILTADGGWRRGQVVRLKAQVDLAAEGIPTLEHVLVVRRTGEDVAWTEGRDHWWEDLRASASPRHQAVPVGAEDPLFILYTSGTTGKPKGLVHTTGGYMTQVFLTSRFVFDLKEHDIYWCTADVGWITGHSYVAYGPLLAGATAFLYEGAPLHPGPDRFWDMIARWGITILYTAPTAIRTFMRLGDEHPARHDLSTLRLLGTVGEPINPEAWMWYHRVIGGERCPIVDTWWQTETGAIMIAPLPGLTTTRPGSATQAFFGIKPDIVDPKGQPVPDGQGGYLVIREAWPSMARTIHGDHARYLTQYWSQVPGAYFTGDGARRDAEGYHWIMGRVDDVINVAGHRLGTMEIESALVSHPTVAEAAVVGRPDEVRGTAVVAFVTLKAGLEGSESLKADLKNHVAQEIGAIARPEEIRLTDALPKTRSGKIMRRLLRELAAGSHAFGDTTTLEDLSVLATLRQDDEG
ncbi:MAG: acetate--CoA ligase [Candidatus Sericytochromatia bacterium]|nr:acetate--CoA ligase [Candidatus Sericytochromatia bacterium]